MDEARRDRFMEAVTAKAPDFNPLCILTHTVHETGWFSRVIGMNNYWGITTPKGWMGNVTRVPTAEMFTDIKSAQGFINRRIGDLIEIRFGREGVEPVIRTEESGSSWFNPFISVRLWRRFADWVTPEEAVLFYVGLISRLYPAAYEHRDDPDQFFEGLVSGQFKWATDPDYVNKLKMLCGRLKYIK